MSSATQTIEQVSSLIGKLPGVGVLTQSTLGNDITFEVSSQSAASTHTLLKLCQAANVALSPPILLRDPDFNTDLARTLSISASAEEFNQIHFGNLQILGIHLVWHLHAAGRLPSQTANELLLQWNGSRVGA